MRYIFVRFAASVCCSYRPAWCRPPPSRASGWCQSSRQGPHWRGHGCRSPAAWSMARQAAQEPGARLSHLLLPIHDRDRTGPAEAVCRALAHEARGAPSWRSMESPGRAAMTSTSTDLRLTPSLTPTGRLVVVAHDDAPVLEPALGERIRQAFERGSGHGLLRLGGAEVGQVLPPALSYWRDLGSRFVTALCTRPETEGRKHTLPPPPDDLETLAAGAPLMPGAEYLTADLLCDFGPRPAKPSRRARRVEAILPGVSEAAQPGLEPGRPRALQPGREPQGRGGAVRLPGDLHHPPVGPRQGAAPAARPGAARVRRARPTRSGCCRCCCRCSARPRSCALAAGDGRRGRDLPSAALDAATRRCDLLGDAAALERAGVVVRMPAGWNAQPPAAAAGDRDRRRPRPPSALGQGCAARLPHGGHARRRAADGRPRCSELLAAHRAAWRWCAASGSRSTASGSKRMMRAVPRGGAGSRPRAGCPSPRRCACWPARTSRGRRRGDGRRPRLVAGRRRPLAGRDARRACASPRGSRASIPAARCTARCGRTSRSACAGCTACRSSGLGACLADDMGLGKTIQVLALLLVLQDGAEPARGGRACWWRRPRCSPTGPPRSSASRPA